MVSRALRIGEAKQCFRTPQCVEECLSTARERIVLRQRKKRRAMDAFNPAGHREPLYGCKIVTQIARAVYPVPTLRDTPVQLSVVGNDLFHTFDKCFRERPKMSSLLGRRTKFDCVCAEAVG